jgi:AraC-like DNA-binding protein
MLSQDIPADLMLFLVLYGITGAVPFSAALYLLFRRGNAIAPDVTPPVRLRRWAASFFAAASFGHVLWYCFYNYSSDINSACYVVVAVLDCMLLLTTIAGTLLAMLQDRKHPVWPVFAVMVPFVAIGITQIIYPASSFMSIATIYILSLYVLFSVYMVFAVRKYGRWLNDNYADLENKKVWLSQLVSLACLLLIILYALADVDTYLIYVLHIIELVLFALLLYRVETLPCLTAVSTPIEEESVLAETPQKEVPKPSAPLRHKDSLEVGADVLPINIDLAQIERLLKEHCVNTQLYLQHDLTLQQLAQTVGTNRYYLSQYFSRQGITYNTYINNLRINHFISCYEEATAKGTPIVAQQLASDSGYRSYSTFSLAFKQRTGQSVTAWVRESGE